MFLTAPWTLFAGGGQQWLVVAIGVVMCRATLEGRIPVLHAHAKFSGIIQCDATAPRDLEVATRVLRHMLPTEPDVAFLLSQERRVQVTNILFRTPLSGFKNRRTSRTSWGHTARAAVTASCLSEAFSPRLASSTKLLHGTSGLLCLICQSVVLE